MKNVNIKGIMKKRLSIDIYKEVFYSLSVFMLSLIILLVCDVNQGAAAERSDETISSGSGQATTFGVTHYGIIGQSSPVGMSTVSNGNKIISGSLITSSGVGAYSELDSDIDGTPDADDELPENPLEDTDTDRDGIGNNADTDDDNDGILDSEDQFPLIPFEKGSGVCFIDFLL